jgi:hypothetical protein
MSVKKPVIDLGYRPQSYFWPITHDTHVIAAIKGERRRSAIRDAFDADSVTPLDVYASPTLPDEDRLALGRLHPSFMGKDRIRYRVVDEYNGDTLSEKRTRSSKRPLSLGELIDFFLGAWPLQEVLEMNELDRDGAQDFTRPSSEVYPQFEAGIRARIDGWYGEGDE